MMVNVLNHFTSKTGYPPGIITLTVAKTKVKIKVGFKARRKNVDVGKTSKAMILPALLEIKDESTMAGNRLVLSDPRGEIPERALLEFYEKYIEPNFWAWYQQLRLKHKEANANADTAVKEPRGCKGI